VITRAQLLDLGFTSKAIDHRRRTGRLHDLHKGVFSVGTPDLGAQGRWMAAALAAGDGAGLSHGSAAALWGFEREGGRIEISVPSERNPRIPGLRIHRRKRLQPRDLTRRLGIPLTTPTRTLLDLAVRLSSRRLERAVNEADKLDLLDPESLREWVEARGGQDGVAALRRLLDARTFVLTDSELERRFLPIARRAGLPKPRTGDRILGYRVDFHWPELSLVVETDGLRYHRTPAQQAKDRRRDQALTAAGLTVLRFTHEQVRHEPRDVARVLATVAARASVRR
jgi:very-short-patch-repair endonuclease